MVNIISLYGYARFLALAVALLAAASPRAEEAVQGPILAQVLRVVDGDTIEVRARIWLGLEVTTLARLDGVDTPELRGPCAAERALARRARDFLAERIGAGPVILAEVQRDKFGGRVLARIADADGADLAAALIAAGLARAYAGGARAGWCGD